MTDVTLKMLEDQIQTEITRLQTLDDDPAKRSKAVQDIVKLVEKLTEAECASEKWYDNQERREIDKERNKTNAEIERRKLELDWKRMTLEIGKIVIPTFVPLIVWRKSFKEMITFEETGRFTSSVSRELHLPRIFNK